MKKLLLLILLCLSFQNIKAQEWAPIGATWHYQYSYAWTAETIFVKWTATKDSMVDGHLCRIIESDIKYSFPGYPQSKLITYEDSGIVYWYNLDNKFTILYNFNTKVGDYWKIATDTCELVVVVTEVGIDTINGHPLRYLKLYSHSNNFSGKIIEYIGHLTQPYPCTYFSCNSLPSDLDNYYGLRCYEDTIIGFHDFKIAPSCEDLSVDETVLTQKIKLYPNPAIDQIHIQCTTPQEYDYTIFNSLGQIVLNGNLTPNSTTIAIPHFYNGLYNLVLKQQNKSEAIPFIVDK